MKNKILDDDFSLLIIYQLAISVIYDKIGLLASSKIFFIFSN